MSAYTVFNSFEARGEYKPTDEDTGDFHKSTTSLLTAMNYLNFVKKDIIIYYEGHATPMTPRLFQDLKNEWVYFRANGGSLRSITEMAQRLMFLATYQADRVQYLTPAEVDAMLLYRKFSKTTSIGKNEVTLIISDSDTTISGSFNPREELAIDTYFQVPKNSSTTLFRTNNAELFSGLSYEIQGVVITTENSFSQTFKFVEGSGDVLDQYTTVLSPGSFGDVPCLYESFTYLKTKFG